jgi:hypothetical protein
MFTPSGRFSPGKKVVLLLPAAALEHVTLDSAMHVYVRLSSRKLESAVVSRHNLVGKHLAPPPRKCDVLHTDCCSATNYVDTATA